MLICMLSKSFLAFPSILNIESGIILIVTPVSTNTMLRRTPSKSTFWNRALVCLLSTSADLKILSIINCYRLAFKDVLLGTFF